MNTKPITLTGKRVRLEPLVLERDFERLAAVVVDPDLWIHSAARCVGAEDLRRFLEPALIDQARGGSLPFTIVDLASGEIAGCTRFANIDVENRHVEIGWTRIGRKFQRTHVNTETKLLMLEHAFESAGCTRVELKTFTTNLRSRTAMLRLGCVEEGVLRKRVLGHDGKWNDVVYYSVLDTEWPAVKARLTVMAAKGRV